MLLTVAILTTGVALLTFVVVEWLRHRSYRKHRASGDVPSTQSLVIKRLLIGGMLELLAIVCLGFWLAGQR